MKVGIGLSADLHLTAQQQLARSIEEAGFASLWTNEASGRDALLVCQAWVAATDRLAVGTGIVPLWTRSAPQLAMAAATIQELSGGRLLLGLGVSHPATMGSWHGVDYRHPLAAARETLEVLRTLFAGGTSDLEGTVVRTRRFSLQIDELPTPPRLYLAAMGPRMLTLAGEHADGALLNWCSPHEVTRAATVVRDAAAQRQAPVEVAAYVRVAVDEDRHAARRALAGDLCGYLALPAYAAHLERQGFGAEVAAVKDAFRENGPDAAAEAVPDDMLTALGWYGTPNEPADPLLSRFEDAGLDHLVARVVPTGGDVERSVRNVLRSLQA